MPIPLRCRDILPVLEHFEGKENPVFRVTNHKQGRHNAHKGQGTLITLNLETAEDWWEVEALYDLCFAPGREALSSYRLRDDVSPVADLSLLARDQDGILAAAIRFWPVTVGGRRVLLLGPIAVHPTRQGEGLGGYIMLESLRRAANLGWERVMLVGDAPYYSRFGFEKLKNVEMPPPTNPDRVLGIELTPGAWQSVSGLVERAG